MKKIHNAEIQKTVYGSYTPQYFYKVDGGAHRYDEYKSNLTGEISGDAVKVLNFEDLSPVKDGRENSEKCYYCYINAAHSVQYCKSKI